MEVSSLTDVPPFSNQSHFLIPPRVDQRELLDIGAGSIEDVEANFADMWRMNHYLGGLRALTIHLYPRLLTFKETPLLVDIGTGSADMTRAISRWAIHHHLNLKLHGIDLSARNLAVARCANSSGEQVKLIQANALNLPFKSGKVDYFLSSLFLHHLSPEQVKVFLARTFESARRGIIMTDLVRGRLPLWAFKIGQPIFARNFLTQHDGVTSIQRAYTPSELLQLAQAAGLPNALVYRHPLWRMTLVADK